ncbi:MAG: DUF1800 family protein [Blastocatellia bacterium]|nr:DUF1800 family protein [Blastocatellia bacterium]
MKLLATLGFCLIVGFPAQVQARSLSVTAVSLSPATDTLPFNGTRQFSASVTDNGNTAVQWSVNGVVGGNSTIGTISASGLYIAPATLPAVNPVMVKATSMADPTASATATVTVRYPTPQVQWYSPSSKIPLGPTTFFINGTQFYSGAVAMLDGNPLPTTYVSLTQLKVTSNIAQSSSGYITVVNPGPPGAVSQPRLIEFGQGIVVTVTPATATVAPAAQQQFTVSVTGTTNTTVYWYVVGGSTNGTITSSGLYKAPNTVPGSPVSIRAVSAVNSERSGTATVTVGGGGGNEPVVVSLSPATATVQIGATQQFTATVTGTANSAVTWQVNGVTGGNATTGTITTTGLYSAPGAVPAGSVTVTAISQADTTKQASAAVTVSGQPPTVSISISPASASVQTGATRQFSATVTGSANTAVTWQVNGVTGGNATNGTISTGGLYTAPAAVPAGAITVTVVSQADPTKQASASVTVTAPPPVVAISISPASASVPVAGTQQFTATVTGSANTAVTWQVNNVTGGNSSVGTINTSGLYSAPVAIPSGTVTVTAISQADSTKKANASVNVTDPQAVTVGRFLEQATFGPTPQLTAYVKQVGIQQYLNEQFNTPESIYPNGNASTAAQMTDQFFFHLLNGQDQVRQRVVYALSEIIVISSNKNYYPNMLIPWQQILSKHAFGNYKNLLKEITLDSSMGNFLDMVNSTKPGVAGGANENYARELMQLFSIGLYQLNQDGSQVLDGTGKPIPTYNQTDVRQLALALTGWTFPLANGTPTNINPNYAPGPMVPLPAFHDTSSKTFLGQTLPANQTMQKDIDDVIEIVFNHPNTGPFLASRLIRAMVTSNPSPGYISRVAAVFNNNGQGVRGDMKAVISAILLDTEARNDSSPGDFGRLRTPIQHHVALLRLLGGNLTQPSQIAYAYSGMGESVLNAPSVFGHYSPTFRIPKQSPPLFGPEFQIHGPGELVNRFNLLWDWMNYYQTGIWDLQWLFTLGSDHPACVNAVDNLLLHGRMSAGLRQQLLTTLQTQQTAGADAKTRALTVLYLTATSSEYLVAH